MGSGASALAKNRRMVKPIIATILWFEMCWSATALLAPALGLPTILAPIAAVLGSAFVWFDPYRLFWARPAASRTEPAGTPAPVLPAEQ